MNTTTLLFLLFFWAKLWTTNKGDVTCGFNATASDEPQLITSPRWPNQYPPYQFCVWILKSPNEFQVQLTVETFEINRYDTLKIFENTDFPVSFTGNQLTQTMFHSLNGFLKVTFTSSRFGGFRKRGFKAFFSKTAVTCGFNATVSDDPQVMTSLGWPESNEDEFLCLWTLTAHEGFQIKLLMEFLDIDDDTDLFTVYDGSIATRPPSFSSTRTYVSNNKSLKIKFYVSSLTPKDHKGFNTSFTKNCGFNATAKSELQVLTSPGWPLQYLPNQNCVWVVKAAAGFWIRLTIEQGYFREASLTIYEDEEVLMRFRERPLLPKTFYSLNRILILKYSSQFSSFNYIPKHVRPRFQATYTIRCVANISVTNEDQVLATPTWPDPSPNNLNCRWLLKAPEGFQVKLTIHQFNINTNKEILTVFDGCRTIPLGVDSANNLVIFSTSGTLTIEYYSGDPAYSDRRLPIAKDGFNATVVGIPCFYEANIWHDACDQTVTCEPSADNDVITSTSICKIKNQTELRQRVFGTFSIVTCSASRRFLCNNPISYLNLSHCDFDCPAYFRCQNNQCVERSSVCDGDPCNGCQEDDEWEDGIGFRCLRNREFCRIPQSMLWDAIRDCDQGEDLCFSSSPGFRNASDLRFLSSTTFKESLCFHCLDQSMIIPRRKVCDGIIDCSDLSDECLCEGDLPSICDDVTVRSIPNTLMNENPCAIGEVSCGNGKCINRTSVCDSIADCEDNIDEKSEYCGVTLNCADAKEINKGQKCRCQTACSQDMAVFCDGRRECNHGNVDDECSIGCRNDSELQCRPIGVQITGETFRCLVSVDAAIDIQTFSVKKMCDGVVDCTFRKEDEDSCENRFPCQAQDLISISVSKVCDGIYDCDDKSDEEITRCSQRFYCPVLQNTKVSIDNDSVCDLHINCDDSSDEIRCLSDGRFYCESKSPLFVSKAEWHQVDGIFYRQQDFNNRKLHSVNLGYLSFVFDGHEDCSDASDECPTTEEGRNEDLFSSRYQLIANPILRALVWIMGLMAFSGNMIVICGEARTIFQISLQSSSAPLRTSHILIFNLAIADLLMGIYLIMLGVAGVIYDGVFCLHKLEWLSSTACTTMGVLVVLSSEASVITMVLLTSCRLYAVVKPFEASSKPKASTIYILVAIGWFIAFVMALAPLTENLQYIFANEGLISQKSFFKNTLINFDSAKSWAMRSVTYGPGYNSNPDEVLVQIQNVVSWNGFQNAVHQLNLSSSFRFSTYFGYYSASSVCIPRLFQSVQDDAFAFSFAITVFNFLGFTYILTAYVFIVVHTKRKSMQTNGLGQDSRLKIDKRNAAMQRKILRLLITDFCCWVPLSVIAFLAASEIEIDDVAYVVSAIVLLPINSALNPVLYSGVVGKVIQRLRKICRQSATSKDTNVKTTLPQGGTTVQKIKKATKNTKQPNAMAGSDVAEEQNTYL